MNGRRICDDFGTGSRVYFVCNDNYVLQGSSVLLCGDRGGWDNPTPTCTLADRKFYFYGQGLGPYPCYSVLEQYGSMGVMM